MDYKNLSYTTTWFELQCVGILTWWYFWWVFVLEGGYCIIPDELYLTKKMSGEPELVFPSNPPSVEPVT